MSLLTAKAIWNIAKGKLKQRMAQLADDPVEFKKGKESELTGRIQKRSAESKNPRLRNREYSGCKL